MRNWKVGDFQWEMVYNDKNFFPESFSASRRLHEPEKG